MKRKKCTKCKRYVSLSRFGFTSAQHTIQRTQCKPCEAARQKRNNRLRKQGKYKGSNYNKPTGPKEFTIFSVDPATGQPFMTVEDAKRRIAYHLLHKAPGMLTRIPLEDAIQELLLHMVKSGYDPTKGCQPTTWLITCIETKCWNIAKHQFTYDKHKECPDKIIADDNEEIGYATDIIGQDHTTPEDIAMANELLERVYKEPHIPRRKMIVRESGWSKNNMIDLPLPPEESHKK